MSFDPNAPDAFAPDPATKPPPKLLGWGQSRPLPADLDLDKWPVEELLDLRAAIELHLPVKGLQDMDLARELVMQVLSLKKLQAELDRESDDTPVNQKAQVANSLSSALVNLVKMQTEIYNAERFKRMELALIAYLKSLPDDAKREEALALYEAQIEARNG